MKDEEILIVEPNEDVRKSLLDILKYEGYQAAAVATGSEALQILKKKKTPLVITAMLTGEFHGLNVLEKAKELSPTTEVIILTGYGTVEFAFKAGKMGASAFLVKPPALAHLLQEVGFALEKHKKADAHGLMQQ